ncbi:MAG TPA: glycosyl hydrolase family 18 protein [Terracidiphilus sp.]|nr:glycosyl hydrolase family 18 protein [Terracidiphilus sp.]
MSRIFDNPALSSPPLSHLDRDPLSSYVHDRAATSLLSMSLETRGEQPSSTRPFGLRIAPTLKTGQSSNDKTGTCFDMRRRKPRHGKAAHVGHWDSALRLRSFGYALLLTLLVSIRANAGILHQRQPLVVAYFAQSGLYSEPPVYLRDLVDNGAASLLNQINYAHASVVGGRCSIGDPEADLETAYASENSVNGTSDDPDSRFRGYFHQLKQLKHLYSKLRILISLEGEAADFREDAKPENLHEFVASCVDIFLRGHFAPGVTEPGIFDGIDVDWEFPQRSDAENFRALIAEFRRQMNAVRRGLKLSIAVGDRPEMQPGTDFRALAPLVDEIGIMNYDYTGPWESRTGFLAPLFPTADAREYGSVAESITAYEKVGVPDRKLLMGIPFYGYEWRGVSPENSGLFQRGKGDSESKPYRTIRRLQSLHTTQRNRESRAPWIFDGANFWTFEDPISVAYKCRYAAHRKLKGIMIWELGQDTAEATLLTAAWRSLQQASTSSTFAEPTGAEIPAAAGS